jgi:deferrochelatase/peroxidase EfeB
MHDKLQRGDVQAIVLESYKYPISRHFLLHFADQQSGRALLAELLPWVTDGARDIRAQPGPLLNIGLSWQGLLAIGAFDSMGGQERAERAFYIFNELPDPESLRLSADNDPSHWWNGQFETSQIHATVHVYVHSEEQLEQISGVVRQALLNCRVTELKPTRQGTTITGQAFSGSQLHFGYRDGISQPDVNWDNEPNRPDLVERGHFLLGESSEEVPSFPDQPPYREFVRRGSFMALVWMYQDVARFNRFLREEGPRLAPHLPAEQAEEWLAAKMMGRWRDGTPLALSPDRPDPELASANAFGYADDPQGLKCPLAAHVRIANGRDQPLNARNAAMFASGFPRVLRRGAPYGPPLAGVDDDGVDRGVVGMFLCTNLNKQFYGITRWLGRTNFSDLNDDVNGQDPIAADRGLAGASTTFSIATANGGARRTCTLPDFVRMQGAAFLLLLSLTTLRGLAVTKRQ